MKKLIAILALMILISQVNAGPLAYGICQTGCNVLAVACYAVSKEM